MPKQTVHPSSEQLTAYNRGLLSPAEAIAIETHISDCEPCCETIVNLSSDDTFVGLLKEARLLPIDRIPDNDDRSAKPSAFDGGIPPELAAHPRYEIVRLIGKGGMGDVYKAIHRKMERRVALKVINRDLFRQGEAVNRFHREVKAAAQLSHPNIVTAFDADQAGDFHFMVMEFVDGVDLSQIVKDQGALPVADACDYIRQAAMGLQHAHERGMVHRDIKPHNLMVTADGTVKVLDFGLASLAPEVSPASGTAAGRSDLTAAGAVMGTPDFMSPEQASDASQVDIRSDIYSLGATFYFLLSGRAPFSDGSVMHKLKSHAHDEPDSLKALRNDVPNELVAIVSRMMAKAPDERYFTPREVADALETFLRTWRPGEAESREQVPSSGGNGSGSDGQQPGAGDASPDWLARWAKWLFYIPFIPIAILILDVFFLSDEASVAASDRMLYVYIPAALFLSTISGALAAAHSFRSKQSNHDGRGVFQWTRGETLVVGLIMGAAAVLWYIETDFGLVRIDVTDPSIQVSVQDHIVTMKESDGQTLSIAPGDQMLLIRVKEADFDFHTDVFKIRRGDEIAFRVEVQKDEVVVLKDGEPFDRQTIINLADELAR